MKVYCHGTPIKEVASIHEGNEFIKTYQRSSPEHYEPIQDKSHKLIDEIIEKASNKSDTLSTATEREFEIR